MIPWEGLIPYGLILSVSIDESWMEELDHNCSPIRIHTNHSSNAFKTKLCYWFYSWEDLIFGDCPLFLVLIMNLHMITSILCSVYPNGEKDLCAYSQSKKPLFGTQFGSAFRILITNIFLNNSCPFLS